MGIVNKALALASGRVAPPTPVDRALRRSNATVPVERSNCGFCRSRRGGLGEGDGRELWDEDEDNVDKEPDVGKLIMAYVDFGIAYTMGSECVLDLFSNQKR